MVWQRIVAACWFTAVAAIGAALGFVALIAYLALLGLMVVF